VKTRAFAWFLILKLRSTAFIKYAKCDRMRKIMEKPRVVAIAPHTTPKE